MKSHEALIGEAIASLTARLDTWGVDDPAAKAHEYIHDMLRAGWRPAARPVETPTTGPKCPDPTPYREAARASIRAARGTTEEEVL